MQDYAQQHVRSATATLAAWERKIFKQIYGGPICDQGTWRIRTDQELNRLYQVTGIVTDIKVRRLKWLGHVVRMERYRLPRIVLDAKTDGKRMVGRPRLRWLDLVKVDVIKAGIRRWRRKAQGRSEWADVIWEAKSHCKD